MMMSPTSDVDDQAEGAADDDADGKVHDIALGNEFLEFLDHKTLLPLMTCPIGYCPTHRISSKYHRLHDRQQRACRCLA